MNLNYDKLISNFDDYGRKARPIQELFLSGLVKNWDRFNYHAVIAQVGAGKSDTLRTIQKETGAAIITSENGLVDQYAGSFADLNVLKGKKRYSCKFGQTCADTFAQMQQYCEGCPFQCAKKAAYRGEDTVYNPMSYIMNIKYGGMEAAPVLLIDEAHKLAQFLRMMATVKLYESQCDFKPSDIKDEPSLLKYMHKASEQLKILIATKKSANEKDGLTEDYAQLEKLEFIKWGLENEPAHFIFYVSDEFYRKKKQKVLTVEALKPPKNITDILKMSKKILMTSGTMFPHHVTDLIGDEPYSFTELPAPIPANQRVIKIDPCAATLNRDTDPRIIAAKIKEIMLKQKGKRGIIHATYSLAEKLKEFLPDDVLTHGTFDKSHALEAFKKGQGNWLLASGMAEGVDLPGDLARVNIITKLQFPNLGDHYVQKRKSLKDGQLWYLSETLSHLIQAAGRTTRGVDDHSITYLLDPGLDRVISQLKSLTKNNISLQNQYLPEAFLSCIRR